MQCCGPRPFIYGSGSCFHFDPDPDPAFQFDTDPDPHHFNEVHNVPKTVLFIHLNLIFRNIGPTGPNQKAYFVKFSLLVNFVVLIRVAYGSRS
jgi:hypothetical protein